MTLERIDNPVLAIIRSHVDKLRRDNARLERELAEARRRGDRWQDRYYSMRRSRDNWRARAGWESVGGRARRRERVAA